MNLNILSKFKISNGMINVAKISFGTISGQIITFITLPLFTRMYGPKVIGIWTLLNSIAVIVNSFSDLGLTNAIMLEKNEKDCIKLYKVISTIIIIISIISSLAIFIYHNICPSFVKLNTIFVFLFMILAIFTLQQIQVCYTWLNRNGKYNILMKNPLINNLSFGIIALVLGLLGFKKYGYFIGWILGQIVTLIHMKRFLPKGLISLKKQDYVDVFNERSRFIKYQLPTNVISNFKNQLPVLLVRGIFGETILGFYSISVKLLNVPITLLASSMGRVYFKAISDKRSKNEPLGEFTYSTLEKAMKIAILPMVCLIAGGDVIINLFFGSGNEVAGIIIRIVAFQNFFTFLMMTLQGLGVVLDKQNYNMISCVFQSVGFMIGLGIGGYVFNSIYIGLILMSIAFIIINVTYFCKLFIVMNISWKKYLLNVTKYMLIIIFISLGARVILHLIGIV